MGESASILAISLAMGLYGTRKPADAFFVSLARRVASTPIFAASGALCQSGDALVGIDRRSTRTRFMSTFWRRGLLKTGEPPIQPGRRRGLPHRCAPLPPRCASKAARLARGYAPSFASPMGASPRSCATNS